jgi:uncharacterized protein YjiS (DUF1127 family)
MSNTQISAIETADTAEFVNHRVDAVAARVVSTLVQKFGELKMKPRCRVRHHGLSDHVLADIGLRRADLDQGMHESFWRS